MTAFDRRASWIAAALFAAMIGAGVGLWAHRGAELAPIHRDQTLPALFPVPSFSLVDQEEKTVSRESLRGHVWVADFIYTQCTSACPILSARMVLLQRKLRAPDLRFISFSVDPKNDTPAALKAYADRWHPNESRWRLLSTTNESLAAVTRGFKVSAMATGDVADPILHTDKLILVDALGMIRGFYDSDDPAEVAALARDLQSISPAGSPDLPAVTTLKPVTTSSGVTTLAVTASVVTDGQALFASLGCNGCHDNPMVAPILAGIANQPVTLVGGAVVTADRQYLREAVVAPAAQIVQGYGATMPAYSSLSEPELAALVDYLLRLQPKSSPGSQARRRAVDPVCKMEISAGEDSLHSDRDGKTYYFCSEACRTKFDRDPSRYIPAAK